MKKRRKEKVENLYNLSDEAIYQIKRKERGYIYGERHHTGARAVSIFFTFGIIIVLLIGIIINNPVHAVSVTIVFSLFVVLNEVSSKEIRNSYRDLVIETYNNFYEQIKGKPFLPSSDRDVEAFFVWLHGETRDFEERMISEETYMQIGLAYGESMGGEYTEEDDDGNVLKTVRYFHTARRDFSKTAPRRNSDLSRIALSYQIFRIYEEVK